MEKIKKEVRLGDSKKEDAPTSNTKLLPIVMEYNSLGFKLINSYKRTLFKHDLQNRFKIVAAYKNHKNFKNILVHNKILSTRISIDPILPTIKCRNIPPTKLKKRLYPSLYRKYNKS